MTDPTAVRVPRAAMRVAQAWGALALVHAVIGVAGLDRLGRLFARPVRQPDADVGRALLAPTWHAVDRAQRVYPARVACLHRAAATVYLLRRRGVPAQLVVGVRNTPFETHAWVELDGRVVGSDHDAEVAASYAVVARV